MAVPRNLGSTNRASEKEGRLSPSVSRDLPLALFSLGMLDQLGEWEGSDIHQVTGTHAHAKRQCWCCKKGEEPLIFVI